MARTVVPPQVAAQARPAGPDEAVVAEVPVAGDSLPEKLVKYVPAETLAFFVPLAAAIGPERRGLLIAVVVIGLIGNAGYLWWNGRRLPQEERPLPHFFLLATIAFLCWAIATAPNVAAMLGVDSLVSAVILGGAVFLIPLADQFITVQLRRVS
jgi:hypothetical protein